MREQCDIFEYIVSLTYLPLSRMLNYIAKRGASWAQMAGVVALMYSGKQVMRQGAGRILGYELLASRFSFVS